MRRNLLLALGAFVLVVLFWKLRMTDTAVGYEFSSSDFYTQLYPMWVRAGAWMRAGILPLWNPYQSCGQPFLASVLYGVLYPPNLVRLVLPAAAAIEVNIVLHLWLAAAFMYLYARTIGLAPVAAGMSAVAYALSGGIVYDAGWFSPAIAAVVWLPLGFAAVERVCGAAGRSAGPWIAVLAVALAMPILAGWLQAWLYNAYAIGGYAACHLAWGFLRRRSRSVRTAVFVAAAFVLAFGLAAAQLLPSMELQALGPRAPGGLSVAQSLPMGVFAPEVFLRGAVDAQPGYPRQTYAGMGALLLLPLALVSARQRGRSVFFIVMAAGALLVSFSIHTPIYALFRLLPGGNLFRAPWRILSLYSFAVAALSGIAFDSLLRRSRAPRIRSGVLVMVIAAALLLAVDLSIPSRVDLVAAAALLLVLALAPWRAARIAGFSFAVFVGADLFLATSISSLRPYGHLEILDAQKEVFDFIAERQGLDRTLIADTFPPPEMMFKQGTLRGIYSVSDYEGLSLNRTAAFYRALSGRFAGSPPAHVLFNGGLALDSIRLKQLGVMSVRFIVVRTDDPLRAALEAEGWAAVFNSPDGSQHVYESPRVLPRAYVAHSSRVETDPDAALLAMLRGFYDPWRYAVLEADGGPPPEASESTSAQREARRGDIDPVLRLGGVSRILRSGECAVVALQIARRVTRTPCRQTSGPLSITCTR